MNVQFLAPCGFPVPKTVQPYPLLIWLCCLPTQPRFSIKPCLPIHLTSQFYLILNEQSILSECPVSYIYHPIRSICPVSFRALFPVQFCLFCPSNLFQRSPLAVNLYSYPLTKAHILSQYWSHPFYT